MEIQEQERKSMIQTFMEVTKPDDDQIPRIMLEMHQWNLDSAIDSYLAGNFNPPEVGVSPEHIDMYLEETQNSNEPFHNSGMPTFLGNSNPISYEVDDSLFLDVESQAPYLNNLNASLNNTRITDEKDAEEALQQTRMKIRPRTDCPNPIVNIKQKRVKRPNRRRERRPSKYFIKTPVRRASEYALPARQKRSVFGFFMIAVCTAMFLFELSLGGWKLASLTINPTVGPTFDVLLKAGAKSTPLILDGEAWRIFTPMILHSGVVHLVFNMMALWYLGSEMEQTHGWQRLAFLYIFSGMFGTLCSAIFVPDQIMVGASGAIFGVVGARWADLLQNWSVLTKPWKEFCFLWSMTALNVVLGFMPFLDNFAHSGGLVMGMLCGLMLLIQNRVDRYGFSHEKKCYQLVLASIATVLFLVLVIVGFVLLYSGPDIQLICPKCSKLSCLEFPPGASTYWWDCHDCATASFGITQYSNGTFYLTCPTDDTTRTGFTEDPHSVSKKTYLDFCKSNC